MPDSFIEHGTAVDQRHRLQLDAEGIAQQVLSVFFSGEASSRNETKKEVAARA